MTIKQIEETAARLIMESRPYADNPTERTRNAFYIVGICALMDALTANDAVKFDDASFAILQTVGEQEVWTEVTIKSKSWKDTKTSKAFDPYEAAEAWEAEKKIKEADKAAKAAEKAKKVAKAKEKEGE